MTAETAKSTTSPRQPNRRAIRQVMRKMNAHSAKPMSINVRKYGSQVIAMCHHPDGCAASEGTRDAPRRGARDDGDDEQDNQVQAIK